MKKNENEGNDYKSSRTTGNLHDDAFAIHNKLTINTIIQPVLLQIIIDTIAYFSSNKYLM